MNIQIYSGKKNFDTQKAERYFKERRIPFQSMDLKKHRLGEREIRLMMNAIGPEALIAETLIDREDKKVKEHPACYYNQKEMLVQAILEEPWLLKTPIVRNGNRITCGYHPEIWDTWE